MLQKVSPDINLYIMYDIACTLVQHLKAKGATHFLERMKFALPSFHAYGHNAVCQVTRLKKYDIKCRHNLPYAGSVQRTSL